MDFASLQEMVKGSGSGPNLGGMGRGGGGLPPAAAAAAAKAAGSGVNPAELRLHADNMWKMLDELAASDPDGYKKFIAKQMEEVAEEKRQRAETEALFTPTPAFVIFTRQLKPTPERIVYLNICSSPQVPPLQTKDRKPAKGTEPMGEILIPLSVGALREDTDDGKQVWTSDIVFHPTVVTRSTTDLSFKLFMLELALQHLEEDCKLTLHRAYKFMPPSKSYVGTQPSQQKTESEIEREKFVDKMKKDREEKLKNLNTKPKDIVMPSLAKQQAAREQYEQESLRELKLRPDEHAQSTNKGGASSSGSAAPVKKKVLIEDLTPDVGEDESLKIENATGTSKPAASAASRSSKPAISLASTTKSTSSSSSSSSSSSFSTSSSASSASVSAPVTTTTSKEEAAPFSSKTSSAISNDEFLNSLAAIPVEASSNTWPYGSSSASMASTATVSTRSFPQEKLTPSHNVRTDQGKIDLEILLPEVSNVAEVEVDLSSTQLKLSSAHYQFQYTFPQPVDEENYGAKFLKKAKKLVLNFQTK